jgi:hypothetical protein
MKRSLLFLLFSFTIIPVVSVVFFVLFVRGFGAPTIVLLGATFFLINFLNPVVEESARYFAARFSRIEPGWAALAIGAVFGAAEQYALSFTRDRQYPDDVLYRTLILASPLAVHAVSSVLCAASAHASSRRAAGGWFATAVVLHILNNNQDLYSHWFTAQTFWVTHVLFWLALVLAAAAAMRFGGPMRPAGGAV